MAKVRILILADDLTGALEVGAKFAAAGVRSQVRSGPRISAQDLHDGVDALVIDTETRHVAPSEAARRVYELAHGAHCHGFSHLYKKTDSTLRGNIGAELAALIEAFPGSPLLYVPAYPQMGRIVRKGSLYVDGVLVAATPFASDPFNPVKESHIPTMLRAQCRVPVLSGSVQNFTSCRPSCIAVCDGEATTDLETAARMFISSPTFRLAAGPSGFATQLARLMDIPRCRAAALPSARNAVIVNGSLDKVSLQQVEQAKREGFRSIDIRAIPLAPFANEWVVLEQESGTRKATLDFARSMARSVCTILAHHPIDALVICGGDTAYAMVEAIGNPPLHSVGEVMEGVPISRIEAEDLRACIGHRDRNLFLVTKAGSFGPPAVLASIRDLLGERQKP